MSRGDLSELNGVFSAILLPIEAVNRDAVVKLEQNRAIINGIMETSLRDALRDVPPSHAAIGIRSIGGFGVGAKPGSGEVARSRSPVTIDSATTAR